MFSQNALDLTAPASDALLKNRKNAWVQLAGHPGKPTVDFMGSRDQEVPFPLSLILWSHLQGFPSKRIFMYCYCHSDRIDDGCTDEIGRKVLQITNCNYI